MGSSLPCHLFRVSVLAGLSPTPLVVENHTSSCIPCFLRTSSWDGGIPEAKGMHIEIYLYILIY